MLYYIVSIIALPMGVVGIAIGIPLAYHFTVKSFNGAYLLASIAFIGIGVLVLLFAYTIWFG